MVLRVFFLRLWPFAKKHIRRTLVRLEKIAIKRGITGDYVIGRRKSQSLRGVVNPVRRAFQFQEYADGSFIQLQQAGFPGALKGRTVFLVAEGGNKAQPIENLFERAGVGGGSFQLLAGFMKAGGENRTFLGQDRPAAFRAAVFRTRKS
jgi:hypothetical protein